MVPFAAVPVLLALSPPRSIRAGILASVAVALSFTLVALALPSALAAPAYARYPWVDELGLNFSVLADGLSLLFALVISGVGLVVFSYATAYLDETENRRRFFIYLLLFMGAMLGVVLSGNLIALFVFWELTSITSYLLIGFWHKRDRSRYGALKALVVTATGGLALLVGFVMIGSACDSYEIQTILERRELLLASRWAAPAAILIILGAITKSAQLPFHLWLPSAMEAPTPVSAYLHAATMVKAGLYLTARLGPLFSEVTLWTPTLTVIGIATMTWSSWMALRQRDLKALLAFSTVSQLGLILSLLAAVEPHATAAGLLHLLNHAAFKGALFLLVGVIEHEAHTRDIMRLGPLRSSMPATWLLLAIGALSMAGVPPLGGFVSKEMFVEHVLALGPLAATVAIGGAAMTAGYCFVLAVGLASGRADGERTPHLHDPGVSLLWGPCLLVAVAVALGLAPGPIAGQLVRSAAGAALAAPVAHLELHLWHGVTPALGASVAALLGGMLVYALWWRRREPSAPTLAADRVYDAGLKALEVGARRLTMAYMSGYLWRYNALLIGTVTGGVAIAVLAMGVPPVVAWPARDAESFELVVALAALVAGIGAAWARTRLAAILALGASGYTLALLFSLLGAPDLALTQVMVETISVALFLAVFVFLPPFRAAEPRALRPGHLALALVFGFGTSAMVWAARGHRSAETIASYFLANSAEQAGGRNVVNVILVDFRGLDTMGEITVLGVAALACYAIIRLAKEAKP